MAPFHPECQFLYLKEEKNKWLPMDVSNSGPFDCFIHHFKWHIALYQYFPLGKSTQK